MMQTGETVRQVTVPSLALPGGRRPRLLFAEDCDPVRVVTTAMLKGMGCDVESAAHGEEAVRLAEHQHFDLIVLDIEMPVMDGITAARSIRRMKGECLGTPLMALSAFLADASQQATWDDTFDLALPKPTNKSELQAAIKTALSWTPASEMAARFAGEPAVSAAKVAELRNGLSDSVWQDLIGITCADLERCFETIEDVVNRRDYGRLGDEAFKLRAIGRTFAAPRLSRAASLLEQAASRREIDVIVGHLRGVIRETVDGLAA
jgi:CheY-like chemotaxis protein